MNDRNGHSPLRAHEEAGEGAQAHEAPMFQGIQGGRPVAEGAGHQDRRRRSGKRGRGEQTMVPDAEFRSYYGRPVLKPPVWKHEIPAYLFTGGLAAGTAVVAAGADLTGRPALRRVSWLGSFAGLLASLWFLVSDLGRPERFHHMLRVVKPTSPMSVGTWILTAFGPGVGAAAVNELVPRRWRHTWPARLLNRLARPLGLSAAAIAPGVASYTAVLLSHTAVPGWNEVRDELPFVFTGSAAASGGGFGMVFAPRRGERSRAGVRRRRRGAGARRVAGDGAQDGPDPRGLRARPRRALRAGRRVADDRRARSARCSWPAAAGPAPRRRGSRCWPAAPASGSGSTTPASSRRRTRSTWWSPSANA